MDDTFGSKPLTKRFINKYFAVRYKSKINSYISPILAYKQDLSINDLKSLKKAHRRRLKLFDAIRSEDDPIKLRALASKMEEIEFQLQDGCKFKRDKKMHHWWFRMPKCECPKMDNEDMLGTGLSVITECCPLHGKIPV
ncbi:MAG: hypothetical protein WC119_01680 [Synergistaceae bacterium]